MKLLVVEDEGGIRELLVKSLRDEGYEVLGVSSAEEAMEAFLRERFEGFLLEVNLPGISGTDLCRWLRNQGVKKTIVLVSAEATAAERIDGLNAGADDYLSKPFDLEELKARLRAFQRKALGYPRTVMTIADLTVDPNNKAARRGDKVLELSKREFELLDYLARNHDRLVTRPMLAKAVWDAEAGLYTNVIDVFFNFLRKKVDDGFTPQLIHNVRGRGFILSETKPVKKAP
jgi:DNA-binding response OmpR family regulator